jgi:hypothetical protein
VYSPDYLFGAFLVLFALGVIVRFRTDKAAVEIALLILSTICMPLAYFAILNAPASLTCLVAPQACGLLLLFALAALLLFAREPLIGTPTMIAILAFAFVSNAVGYLWTRSIWFMS